VHPVSQVLIAFLLVPALTIFPAPIARAELTSAFYVSGVVVSHGTRLPGVLITAENAAIERPISTVSDDNGEYRLTLPSPGTYRVRVELFGFSPAERVFSVANHESRADFSLVMLRAVTSTANNHIQPPRSIAVARKPVPQEGAGRRAGDPSTSLSADIPMQFSFITGQVAQPATSAESAGRAAAMRQSSLHFNASYDTRNSALDASPYALHGIRAEKPEYAQNSFGVGVGATLPWVKKAKTSLFASYNGSRTGSPFSGFATVPTPALRSGDFSGTPIASGPAVGRVPIIYDPATGQPFPGNRIPLDRISRAALALLEYAPLPNRNGFSQNFRFVTATRSRSDGFILSLTRVPSVSDPVRRAPLRSKFSAGLAYQGSTADLPNIFPLLGGCTTTHAWNGHLEHSFSKAFFTNELRLALGDMKFRTSNQFRDDAAARLGITGVSHDRFDWGLPAIDFTQFTGVRDVVPMLRSDRSFSLADALSWSSGKHNIKWGGEFRRLAFDLRNNQDGAGAFLFTGFATAQLVNGIPAPGTGSDLADFLLGFPQKTHVQYSTDAFSFAGNAWNLYFVDDWRVTKNVSLNVGLRYEYISPFSEARNRLVTLDAPSDFSTVELVRAGAIGPFTGRYPDTIVAPDRNNFVPRLGIAWRAAEQLILRAGYSISYDPSAYNSLATRLALQPPFAVEQIGIAGGGQALTLENGFPALKADTVANDFAVSRNLPLGYAQVWVLEIQNELPGGVVLVTSYTGSKGSHLQMFRAPNRTPTGLLLPSVAPFLWQTGEGSSILHAGSLRVQKSLIYGLSFGASYMFSRSIDNDPGLGDETSVAQDDRYLNRERALSAFDQRHRLRINFQYELPFGRGERWLNKSEIGNQLLGGWSFTGDINYASGFPLTPHVVGVADVATGAYGALRPDLTKETVQLSRPTVERFFDTRAFIAPPAGHYGDAGRNIIGGPRVFTFDAAVTKSFTIAELHSLQFQAQASNVLNRPQLAQVDTNLNSLSYGQIIGVGPMRTIQLGLRYSF
jgi:TonB-dependent receptor-like protein/carboxypeptidase family protein